MQRVKTRLCPGILEADRERLLQGFGNTWIGNKEKCIVTFKERNGVRKNNNSPSRRIGTALQPKDK